VKTSKGKKRRITLLLTAGNLTGMHVKERSHDGKYAPLDRPWGEQDLANFRKGGKAINLLARGVSDFDEIIRKVNTPRRKKRGSQNSQKKPAAPQSADDSEEGWE
jgi:hypothetical protein